MADEPRRSGRATKGQHTKMQDTPEPDTKDAKETKKGKTKGKAAKRANDPDPNDEQEEEDALIRCVCGHQVDEGGRMMICCDNCQAWQHNDCMGITEVEDQMPEHYLCEQCDPPFHKPLLDAMKKGLKPWEEIARSKEEANKGKKRRKSGKQANAESTPQPTPPPKTEPSIESNKRKHDGTDDGDSQPAKQRKPSTPVETKGGKKSDGPKAGRKSGVDVANAGTAVKRIDDLAPDARKNVAASIRKKMQPLVEKFVQEGVYKLPPGTDAASVAETQSILVEQAMFINHKPNPSFGGNYKGLLLRLMPSMERNPDLTLRLLTGQITPDALSKMSSEEMSSDEHRKQMATIKAEMEKQAVLPGEEHPRIRRNHKGEEIIDDQSDQYHAMPTTSIARPSEVGQAEAKPASPADGSNHERRSSSNFNIKQVWSNVQPDGTGQPFRQSQSKHRRASQTQEEHDADIDRLLDEEGGDSAPYSPAEIDSQTAVSWQGQVEMTGTATMRAYATHVAGSKLEDKVKSLSDIFATSLDIRGRIASERADQYLSGLSSSWSTDVSVFRLHSASSDPNNMSSFNKLWEYFSDRQRYGVVWETSHRENVRDVYLVPVEGGDPSKLPAFIQRLEYNALENAKSGRILLAVFVLKWRSTNDAQAGTPTAPYTPAVPAPSAMSPTPGPGPGSALTMNSYKPPHSDYGTPMPPGSGGYSQSPSAPPSAPPPQAQGLPAGQYQQSPGPGPYPPQAHHSLPSHSPYQQPPGPPQQQQPSPPPGTGISSIQAMAFEILGHEMFNSPVAQQIFVRIKDINVEQLHNLRNMFTRNPLTMASWEEFTRDLAESGNNAPVARPPST